GIPLEVDTTEFIGTDIYETPLGFTIVSFSDAWMGDKLVEIYNELLNNGHGDEIYYISEVIVYGGSSDDNDADTFIAGTQSYDEEIFEIYLDIPAVFSPTLAYEMTPMLSTIKLFNMDDFETVSEAARTIAHEYGHHYTMHYFLQDDDAARESEYYNIRGISGLDHEVFYNEWELYNENHEWDIYEIAAEDYVQLMGSPNTKQTNEFKDIYQALKTDDDYFDNIEITDTMINVYPQENIYIPLADEVAGLRDYYYSFIGMTNDLGSLETADFNIEMEKKSSNGYRYYNISWTKTSTDPDAFYTLVCYDTYGSLIWPIKTVCGNEDPLAVVGTASYRSGGWIYWWSDGITNEDRIFKVYLILPDGRMQASEPFYADF
ncbi:MAG: hypothetical protein PHO15_10435, partial [Eubacteriales bacterium]|nr:hypothetical protein [Eubacteriales bacterium]